MNEFDFIKRSLQRTGEVQEVNVDSIARAALEASRRYREVIRRTELVMHYAADEDAYVCTEVPALDFYELLKRGQRKDLTESLQKELDRLGYSRS